uniref:MMS1_N domain-containing protein n=1 Tax=Haemonchus contortus TaxID=6289 RepID=A0A7I4YGN5_HAECO
GGTPLSVPSVLLGTSINRAQHEHNGCRLVDFRSASDLSVQFSPRNLGIIVLSSNNRQFLFSFMISEKKKLEVCVSRTRIINESRKSEIGELCGNLRFPAWTTMSKGIQSVKMTRKAKKGQIEVELNSQV